MTSTTGRTSPNSSSRLGSGTVASSGNVTASFAELPQVTSSPPAAVPPTVLASIEVPQMMLSPARAVPQMMLSRSAVPQTTLSQSAPPHSVPQMMLSPSNDVPQMMLLLKSSDVPHRMFVRAAVPQMILSPSLVPQMMLSPSPAVPQMMLSPSVPSVLALPQTTPVPQAFLLGTRMPPFIRWLPQMMWRLQIFCVRTRSPLRAVV